MIIDRNNSSSASANSSVMRLCGFLSAIWITGRNSAFNLNRLAVKVGAEDGFLVLEAIALGV